MNKIEKLELRHLCGYLPHVLKTNEGELAGIIKWIGWCGVFKSEHGERFVPLHEIKPILLPISSLTEPLPDGTVPIVELAKIAGFEDFEVLQVKEGSTALIANLSDNFTFMVLKNNCDFAICAGKEITFLPNQLQLFEYLLSKHFDIFGLIPAGLAIDKTIKL